MSLSNRLTGTSFIPKFPLHVFGPKHLHQLRRRCFQNIVIAVHGAVRIVELHIYACLLQELAVQDPVIPQRIKLRYLDVCLRQSLKAFRLYRRPVCQRCVLGIRIYELIYLLG